MNWEYKVIDDILGYTPEVLQEVLNNLGKESWEIIGIKYKCIYLKRERRLTEDEKRRVSNKVDEILKL